MKLISVQSRGPMLAKITEAERNGYRVECITLATWLKRHLTVSMRWCKTRRTAFKWAAKWLKGRGNEHTTMGLGIARPHR